MSRWDGVRLCRVVWIDHVCVGLGYVCVVYCDGLSLFLSCDDWWFCDADIFSAITDTRSVALENDWIECLLRGYA